MKACCIWDHVKGWSWDHNYERTTSDIVVFAEEEVVMVIGVIDNISGATGVTGTASRSDNSTCSWFSRTARLTVRMAQRTVYLVHDIYYDVTSRDILISSGVIIDIMLLIVSLLFVLLTVLEAIASFIKLILASSSATFSATDTYVISSVLILGSLAKSKLSITKVGISLFLSNFFRISTMSKAMSSFFQFA